MQSPRIPRPTPTLDVAPLPQGLQRRPPLQELAEFVPDSAGVTLGTARALPGRCRGHGAGQRHPGLRRRSRPVPPGDRRVVLPGPPCPSRVPGLTCPPLLAAPQLLPGAEFSPNFGLLLSGDVGALRRRHRETPGPAPGWPRGVGGPAHPPADAVGDGPVPGGDDLLRVMLDQEFRALPRPQLPEQQAKVRERARSCPNHPDLGTRMRLSPAPAAMTPNGAFRGELERLERLLPVQSPSGSQDVPWWPLRAHQNGTVTGSASPCTPTLARPQCPQFHPLLG